MMSAAATRAGQAFVEVLADDSKARRVLKQFQAHTQSWATTMNNLGRAMLLPAVGFGLAMGRTTRVFADFEREMSKVKARLDATDAGFEMLRKKAVELGKSTAFSATEAATAMTKFAEAGYDSARIATIMGPAIDLAAAGLMDLNEAADVIVTTMNAFNLRSEQVSHVVDIIAKASVESASDVRELAQSFVYASTVASVAGVPLQDLVGVLSLLHDSGIKADIAGTSVRGMILSLTSPSEKAAQAMKSLGVQVQDVQGNMLPLASIVEQFRKATAGMGSAQRLKFVGEIFDTRQASAFAKLVDLGADRINKRIDLVFNSTGTAAEVARTQMNNLHGDWKRLVGSFESFQITITDAIVKPLRAMINAMRVAIQVADEFAKRNPMLVKVLVALGITLAVAAPLLIALSVAEKLAGFAADGLLLAMDGLRFGIWLLGTPLKWLIGTLRTLAVFIGVQLVNAFRMLAVAMLMNAGTAIKTLLVAFGKLWLAAHLMLAQITVAIVRTLLFAGINAVTALVSAAISGFAAIGSAIAFVAANPAVLLLAALVAIGAYIIYASGAWSRAFRTMLSAVGRLAEDFKKAWAIIVASVKSGRIDLAFNAVCILMKITWLEFIDFLMTNWEEFADFLIDMWDETVNNWALGISRLQQKWEEFFNWLQGKNKENGGMPIPPAGDHGDQPLDGGDWGVGNGGIAAFGGSSPLGLAASLQVAAIAGLPNTPMGDQARQKRGEMQRRTPEDWAEAQKRVRPGANRGYGRNAGPKAGAEYDVQINPDGSVTVIEIPREGPIRGTASEQQSNRAARHAEMLEGKYEEANKRLEAARAKHEKSPTGQTAAAVALREREAENAKRKAERQRAQADALAKKNADRKEQEAKRKEKSAPKDNMPEFNPDGSPVDKGAAPEEKPPEEKPPQLPAELQQANDDVAAAKKRLNAAATPEEELNALHDLRRAERRQKLEQGRFNRRQGIDDQRKKLDEARKQAEAALGESVGRGEPGNFIGDMLSGAKASVVGTFSASAASGLGAGNSQLTKIASATEMTAKNTKDLKNKKGPVFG